MVMKRTVAIVLAAAMFVSLGFLPGGESSAAGLLSATVPTKYKNSCDVYRCIDISNHQGALSVSQFKQIKALGIPCVILRAGYTRLLTFTLKEDTSFRTNINNAYAAGMKIGIYYYSQAKNVDEAKKEAAYTLKLITPYKSKISMPVAFDYEFGGRLNAAVAKKAGRTAMTNNALAYCNAIRSAGFTPMFYGNVSMLNSYMNRDVIHSHYPVWLAHYTRNGKATDYSKDIYMWQYSSSGRLNNASTGKAIVKGRIDMDYVFVKKGTNFLPGTSAASISGSYKVKMKKTVYKRKGPGKKYKKNGKAKKGKKFTIVETKNGWGKIKKKQWIKLSYTKRI